MRPLFTLGALLLALGFGVYLSQSHAQNKAIDPAALQRTRETVQMLDDLYKNFVVQITATYVDGQEKAPAAKVTRKVFQAMHDKGWHKGRLVDASGNPINTGNVAKTKFETDAIAAIKAGKPYFDEVAEENGKPILRAATVVPVVMAECTVCHIGTKKGDLLGIITYELPVK